MQVGDGTTAQRLSPVAVSGLSAGVVMVAAGLVRARVVCFTFVRVRDRFGRVCFLLRLCQSLRAVVVFGWDLVLRRAQMFCVGCAGGA